MRLLSPAPTLRFPRPFLARTPTPRADLLEDIKYGLSNSDAESRPARDLIENPVAFAYLLVLAAFGAGLAYLLYSDTQAKGRREAALREQRAAAQMLREQGLEQEAAVLDRDLKVERRREARAEAKKDEPKGLAADPYAGFGDEGNRFERRQGREARKAKTEKRRKKRR